MREGVEGISVFKLDIDAHGMVSTCTILVSSGSSLLDVKTCRLMTIRARFSPGRDLKGRPSGGTFQSRIHWQIKRDIGPAPALFPRVNANSTLRFEVGVDGKIVDCVYTGALLPAAGSRLCDSAKAAPAVEPFRNKDGVAVSKIVTMSQRVVIEDK